jgi:hypothetical protein
MIIGDVRENGIVSYQFRRVTEYEKVETQIK